MNFNQDYRTVITTTDGEIHEIIGEVSSTVSSKPIEPPVLRAYWRQEFVDGLMGALKVQQEVKFLVHKNHYNLVTAKMVHRGEYTWNIAGNGYYSYSQADIVQVFETLFNAFIKGDLQLIELHNETKLCLPPYDLPVNDELIDMPKEKSDEC